MEGKARPQDLDKPKRQQLGKTVGLRTCAEFSKSVCQLSV
jgi:hypothetical protein